jgi:hypothetical protein
MEDWHPRLVVVQSGEELRIGYECGPFANDRHDLGGGQLCELLALHLIFFGTRHPVLVDLVDIKALTDAGRCRVGHNTGEMGFEDVTNMLPLGVQDGLRNCVEVFRRQFSLG